MKNKPLQICSEASDLSYHVDGRQAALLVVAKIREALQGVHVNTSSIYHDYFSGCIAYNMPSERQARAVLVAIRSILPDWQRVDVSVHEDRNQILFQCYAHNLISHPGYKVLPYVQPKVTVKVESINGLDSEGFAGLQRIIGQLTKHNPATRDAARQLILNWGLEAHVGGHHVAILKGNQRLALVTGNTNDWN